MPNSTRTITALSSMLLAATVLVPANRLVLTAESENPVRLFRFVTMRADVVLGLTPGELSALGSGSELDRIARRIAEEGELTAWRYVEGRGPDGSARLATSERIAVLRRDALLVERYVAALPVMPPPA